MGLISLMILVVFMMVLLVVLVVMVFVVVLASLEVQQIVVIWSLFVVWHDILDESDSNVLAKGVLNLSVGDFLVA